MKDAFDFSRFDEFWEEVRPYSPQGRDRKDARPFVADRNELERRYDLVDAALRWLDRSAGDPSARDKVSWHLKRLPRLPDRPSGDYGLVELFQFKKFLANYRAIVKLVDDEARESFSLRFSSTELARQFDLGGSDAETFHLADVYDPGLAEARAEIVLLDEALRDARAKAERAVADACGVVFDGRPFVIVDAFTAPAIRDSRAPVALEPYDSTRFQARLLPGTGELELASKRGVWAEREKEAEDRVIARLSRDILAEEERFREYGDSAGAFDFAFAIARLARERALVRPELDAATPEIAKGRLVPCEKDCAALGLSYVPLDFDPRERVTVLFGSNMGGKTVALRTVAFLQLLAQAGCFVPAERFRTTVFSSVRYVGELRADRATGLSGFGFEIRSFVEAWGETDGDSLALFDEFARTTGSHEAEAILSAVIEAVASRPRARAVFATHFRGVARLPGVRYLRMRGLDRSSLAAESAVEGGREPTLERRIAGINGHMSYVLEDDDGAPGASDAIDIAEMLGLDPGIAMNARARYASRGR